MKAHVAALCEAHGIRCRTLLGGWGQYAQAAPPLRWKPGRPTIRIEAVDSLRRYYVALHEIGHVVNPDARSPRPSRRLVAELAAWQWAMGEAKAPPSPGVGRCIAEALIGYVGWAVRRRANGRRSHGIPGPDGELWTFIEAMDPQWRPDHDGQGPGEVWGTDPAEPRRRRVGRLIRWGAGLSLPGAGIVAAAFLTHARATPAVLAVVYGGLAAFIVGAVTYVAGVVLSVAYTLPPTERRGRHDEGVASVEGGRGRRP